MKRLTPEQQELAQNNIKLAYKFAHKWKRALPNDFDEILSCCMTGLVLAAMKFDPSRNIKFSTFCGVTCDSEIIKMLRYWDTQKRKAKTVSLEYEYSPYEDKKNLDLGTMLGTEDNYLFLERAFIQDAFQNAGLQEREQTAIIRYFYQRIKQESIAEELGVTQKTISEYIRKGLGKMRKYGEKVEVTI